MTGMKKSGLRPTSIECAEKVMSAPLKSRYAAWTAVTTHNAIHGLTGQRFLRVRYQRPKAMKKLKKAVRRPTSARPSGGAASTLCVK